MIRRSLAVALWMLVGLLTCVLGALSALVGTSAGRELLARVTERSLNDALAGIVEVGDVRGTLLTSLTLTDVRLFDRDTSLVAWLPRADLTYNPFDLVAGRIVLLALRLDRPVINLVEHRNGRLNFEELLRLGGGAKPSPDTTRLGPNPPARLILFRNVDIEDGNLVLRLLDRESPGDSLLEIDRLGAGARRRVRRFDRLDARLRTLRISSPREKGVLVDFQTLAVVATDPPVELRDVRGRMVVLGDSVDIDFERVVLPGSSLAGRGHIRWPRDTLLYDLDIVADSATLTDFRFIDPRFPLGAVLAGGVDLRSRGSRILEIKLDPLDLRYRGGTLDGRLTAISIAGQGLAAVRQADVEATEFDLEMARPFLDTLPFAGRLSGHTIADGRLSALQLEVNWTFRDSLVEGWPTTRIEGVGEMDLEAEEGLSFRAFSVDFADVDLSTVRRLIPAFRLEGRLEASGTLDGPYRNARFAGPLRHRDPGGPPSVVRGVVHLDSRADTLGVFADVVVDSLSFDGLRGSFPDLPLRGVTMGSARFSGRVDALETHVDLTAPGGGRFRGDGRLVLVEQHYGTREFTLRGDDVNLARWFDDGPRSRLTFTLAGSADVDSGVPRAGRIRATLEPSLLAGAVLDSGSALVRLDEQRLWVDTLHIVQPGMVTSGRGSLGWESDAAGALRLAVETDTLGALDSLLSWAARRNSGLEQFVAPIRGGARMTFDLSGSFDSLSVEADAAVRDLRWRDWEVPKGRTRLYWEPGPQPVFDLTVELDSLARDRFGFSLTEVRARGTPDSLTWFGRSRVGDLAGFLAGGRFARQRGSGDSAGIAVGIDSLAVLVPGGTWFLEAPVDMLMGDSIARLSPLRLANAAGAGRVTLGGDLPARGPVDANVQLESVPVSGLYALLQRDTAGVGGYLTATVNVAGTRAAPTYHGAFALSEGAFGKFRTPFVDGTVAYEARRLDGTLHVWRSGQQILTVTTHLPLDLALAAVERRQLPDTLNVRAVADNVDLTLLGALTPLVRDVRGVFSADLGIGGSWDALRLSGGLQIADAAAFIPALNVSYENIGGRLSLSGDSIYVDSLGLRGGEGRANVSGAVRLERFTRPILRLGIEAQEFRALDLRGFLTLTASGNVMLRGPVLGATLTGRGTVTSGEWHFADLIRKRVVDIDAPWTATLIDTSLAATIRRQRLGPQFESVFLDSLHIHGLELEMGSNVWLRSTEANIQLAGTVRVNKEARDYILTGTLQAPRGVYRLAPIPGITRDFTVTQGTVRYFGTPDLDAGLDIEARYLVRPVDETEDINIIARIGGTLLVPRLTLEAQERQYSQSELISYLLFGQRDPLGAESPGGQAPGQRQQLVRSALGTVFGELERTLVTDLGVPLDYLEIRPQGRAGAPEQTLAGAQLAAGVQIGDRTFLGVKAGFCGGDPLIRTVDQIGASLQFRITSEWRLESSFEPYGCSTVEQRTNQNDQRQFGFDLFWENRY